MCGIIGYAGEQNTAALLLDGLKKLEYRGYDSAGIALFGKKGIRIYKKEGKVAALEAEVPKGEKAALGLGHTRWATHGAPKNCNAHPHRYGRVTLVHNGIIENEQALRLKLAQKGLFPIGDTDTELIAILMDSFYNGDPRAAIRSSCALLEGSYALGILFEDHPGIIYAIRKDSPLILGIGDKENFIASDITAFLEHTRSYLLPEEGELAEITAQSITIYDATDQPIQKPLLQADWDEQAARRGGYAHYMAKEIREQPEAVKRTLSRNEEAEFPKIRGTIRIVGCGSAYHAGLMGKYFLEKYAKIPTEVSIASEFRYSDPLLKKEDLVVIISQSGETADSLAALRLAKERSIPTLGIINAPGSSIAREADNTLYTAAGPEISVATTKAYTCQAALLFQLALRISGSDAASLSSLPKLIEQCLMAETECKAMAEKYADAEHLFFIGRGQDYAVCCEGSLKLKEISYIHSEAYAAGELKHGTISLIEENTPVVTIITDHTRLPKTAANLREVRARGARVLAIAHPDMDLSGCDRINLPECDDALAPFAAAVLCQLFAYHAAVKRGNDVDQPRNLAKSVTVE